MRGGTNRLNTSFYINFPNNSNKLDNSKQKIMSHRACNLLRIKLKINIKTNYSKEDKLDSIPKPFPISLDFSRVITRLCKGVTDWTGRQGKPEQNEPQESRDYHRERNLSLKETNWYEQVALYLVASRSKIGKTRLLRLGEIAVFRDLGRRRSEFAARVGKNPKAATVTHFCMDAQRGSRRSSGTRRRRGRKETEGRGREDGWPNWMEGDWNARNKFQPTNRDEREREREGDLIKDALPLHLWSWMEAESNLHTLSSIFLSLIISRSDG